MDFEEILEIEPYSLERRKKQKMLTKRLLALTDLHQKKCPAYAAMLKGISFDGAGIRSYEELPFLPVRLFKELHLKSAEDKEIVKTMTSSGTTGQAVSKIYLDRTTASNQQKAMVKIVSDFTGKSRMPMIIADCPSVIKDRAKFSARGAGILGFSIFGTKKFYALDDNMKLDADGLLEFLHTYRGQNILLFGFTFMIWQHFFKELLKLKEEGIAFDLSGGIMIHGGGWKKLQSESVSREEFCARLKAVCGLERIYDYYGMVEQTGCISMQCGCGHFHASIFSDVIVRKPEDFSICGFGEPGILQVVSAIPESYPGHSLLTEDEGVILGEDDCPCGRKGKYFRINGRIAQAELRGCSDTYAKDHASGSLCRMPQADIFDRIFIRIGSKSVLERIADVPPKPAFDGEILDFLNMISKELMADRAARRFPDVAALGFWLRRSSLLSMKERFLDGEGMKAGRGTAFHVAPSNVPVNYAYSLFAGLLCGNANIVRMPSKDFPQESIINQAVQTVLKNEKYASLKPYINLVKYGRDKEINDYFSSVCDVRIVWGGDHTIGQLRQSPLAPRTTEIVFSDRYSLALIDSDAYLASENKIRIASDFYNDTYHSDQNACTSPRAVAWMGSAIPAAKEIFWKELEHLAKQQYPFQEIQGVDKLTWLYLAAVNYGKITAVKRNTNFLYRIQMRQLTPDLMDYRGNAGYFYEYDCEDVLHLRDFCNDTRCQTISYIGEKKMLAPLLASGIKGVDRVVLNGHTMDFDLIWDGYNLAERLTRTVRF